ncbi:hypothetical protein LT85_1391 [Collimonas arenae]|uniref:Uncharacterized protein n=1 Tax=Collimonas arenae TaxID=279058 RepID=A0A0A1FA46_9BURK|nr:hypothetical protein LT85_1391 [Collimonas arenae]
MLPEERKHLGVKVSMESRTVETRPVAANFSFLWVAAPTK